MLDTYLYIEHMIIGYKTNVSNTFETHIWLRYLLLNGNI